ncbi:chitinase-3-like protein 1 [Oratosquilla oratoria]|uniref:chitinase-3-like protein 1 n=1 Tax=Oratosquilla oratoria TaxID=337810 RepID=UPI003F77437C
MKCILLCLALVAWQGSQALKVIEAEPDLVMQGEDKNAGPVMVCYYRSWAVYRPGKGKFDVEDIPPALCTHIIYGFAGLRNNQIISLDPWNDLYENYGKGAYDRFNSLKKQNADLKTIIAIGGWNEGSSRYSEMAKSPATRKTFVDSVMAFLPKYGFDGLDMDWEYPTQRGGKPEDKVNFISLLQELKAALHSKGYLLTAAVSAGKLTIDPAYDVPAMAEALDIINVMAYDMHGAWDPYAHHQTPLYAHPKDEGNNLYFNVDFAIQYWLKLGAPASKIAMGMGLYGRCFTLQRAENHDVYDPAPQAGMAGPYTRDPGFMGYNEICEKQMQGGWTIVDDPNMMAPYTYKDRQWCGYEHIESITTKAKYAADNNLMGGMVWSIDTDDFHNTCGNGEFILIKTIFSTLLGGGPLPTLPPTTTTPFDPSAPTTPTTTTLSTPLFINLCKTVGYNADPTDCTIFYECSVGDYGEWIMHTFRCPPGTAFVPDLGICDYEGKYPELCK